MFEELPKVLYKVALDEFQEIKAYVHSCSAVYLPVVRSPSFS